MALYKYAHYLENLPDPRFDPTYQPGTAAPHCGIYKCQGCGREAARMKGDRLPPEDDHEHGLEQGAVLWRLIVAAA
jgi:hypothetical protein